VNTDDLSAALDASRFVGRAPQQVDDFLDDVVDPILAGQDAPASREEVRV
jgi:adenylosuccinate lyase